MNEKHAREVRIVNRLVGTLSKRSDLPVDDWGVTILGRARGERHKVPRAVKRSFDALSHRQKSRRTIYWRSGAAASLKARGIAPKGEFSPPPKRARVPSRSERRSAERTLNRITQSGWMPDDIFQQP